MVSVGIVGAIHALAAAAVVVAVRTVQPRIVDQNADQIADQVAPAVAAIDAI